ncbi:Tol [Fusarium napiforme]|uniref:Tol n=1 Tax=Fusarium napiforme TaxID=42672 RepID=A0A8H5N2T1_9HYPO|nr:Tol [Fusarium napiforme]
MGGNVTIQNRTVTGGMSACSTRRPFTPTLKPRALRKGFAQSNFGNDLQIQDHGLRLMNLTHANAWQLNKSLVMGDSFSMPSLTFATSSTAKLLQR